MNKRIRILTTGSYPDGMAKAYRIHCYAKALKEEGVSVHVICADSYRKQQGRTILLNGVHEGIPFKVLLNNGPFKSKLIAYTWAQLQAYFLALYCLISLRKFDVLWIYGLGLIPRLILILSVKFFGKKVVLELNEYPYGTEGSGLVRRPFIRRMLTSSTFKFVLPQFDGVVVISENLGKVVRSRVPKMPVLKVPILVDLDKGSYNGTALTLKSPHPHPYLFHSGSLTIQKDGIINFIEAYCRAAHILQEIDMRLDLILTNKLALPDVWSKIKQILLESNLLDRLVITGYLTDGELFQYLRYSAALVVNKPSTFQNKFNFPTKIGDYLLSRRPVIVGAQGLELNNYLVNNVNSRVVPPDDVLALSDAIIELCSNEDRAREIGQAGYETAITYFDYHVNAAAVKKFLLDI